MNRNETPSYGLYKQRREALVDLVKAKYQITSGVLILFAGFEEDCRVFRQESSFYYFTGIVDPGVVCVITLDGVSTLYVPQYAIDRSIWLDETIVLDQSNAQVLGFDMITSLGKPCSGYQIAPYTSKEVYEYLLNDLSSHEGNLYSLVPDNADEYVMQRLLCNRLLDNKHIVDISDCVAHMRRTKGHEELDVIKQAIKVTQYAQKAAARAIANGQSESYVRAALEQIMTQHNTRPAFPSIVAAGHNGTVLHYHACDKPIACNDLVVVDIGAEYNYYAADITRTYPASGRFSERQRELYQCVLDAQEHVAKHAKPGYWLRNAKQPEKSLHHIAVNFFNQYGYQQYFLHGIGHYLGLDVHDVGSYQEPLNPGDVITIEPGLYIRDESIGIRIEDNYLITQDGSVCLSADIPKQIRDVEELTAI